MAATPPQPAATTTGLAVTVVGAVGIFVRRNLCSSESLIVGIFARRNYWLTEIFEHSFAGIYVEPAALPESSM
ncbi:hypothetical protein Tco_0067670, partial [Tanacetum coccineum]